MSCDLLRNFLFKLVTSVVFLFSSVLYAGSDYITNYTEREIETLQLIMANDLSIPEFNYSDVDGKWGPKTKKYVAQLSKRHNIDSGIYDVLPALSAIKNTSVLPVQNETMLQLVKDRVKSNLKDPYSAHFKNIFYSPEDSAICGEVNSKNEFGGYVGYRKFIVTTTLDASLVILERRIERVIMNRGKDISDSEPLSNIQAFREIVDADLSRFLLEKKLKIGDLKEFLRGERIEELLSEYLRGFYMNQIYETMIYSEGRSMRDKFQNSDIASCFFASQKTKAPTIFNKRALQVMLKAAP